MFSFNTFWTNFLGWFAAAFLEFPIYTLLLCAICFFFGAVLY